MTRPPIGPNPCIVGCGAIVRRSAPGKPICRGCMATAEQAFRREHSPLDPDWIAARSQFFGNRAVLVPAIRAGRAALAVAEGAAS